MLHKFSPGSSSWTPPCDLGKVSSPPRASLPPPVQRDASLCCSPGPCGFLLPRPQLLLGSRLPHGPSLTQQEPICPTGQRSHGCLHAPRQSLCLFHSPTVPESSMLGRLGQAGRLGWMLCVTPHGFPACPRDAEASSSISATHLGKHGTLHRRELGLGGQDEKGPRSWSDSSEVVGRVGVSTVCVPQGRAGREAWLPHRHVREQSAGLGEGSPPCQGAPQCQVWGWAGRARPVPSPLTCWLLPKLPLIYSLHSPVRVPILQLWKLSPRAKLVQKHTSSPS